MERVKMNLEIMERINTVKEHRLPAGYRHLSYTDSVLPADWPDCQIKDIVKQVIRPVARPDKPYWRLGLRSHAKGTFHEWVEEPEKVEMGTLFEVKENDLILNITFAWEHAVGLIQKKDEICLVSHRFPTYEFINGNVPEFFFAVVCQPWFKKMLANISPGGAGRNRVMSKPSFLCLPCFCPPLQEQQKVAEILSACERVLTLKKELKAQKIKQKKWLMQKLLNPVSGVRLPGFMGEWETEDLGSLAIIKKGSQVNKNTLSPTGPYYVLNGGVTPSGYYESWNTERDTISISEGGNSCGFVFFNKKRFWSGGHCYTLIQLKDCIRNTFLYQYLKMIQKKIMDLRVGSGLPNIQKGDLAEVLISFPSLAEQSAIAEVLSAADRELDLLEEEIQAWERKKKALSQLLLRGIVRV